MLKSFCYCVILILALFSNSDAAQSCRGENRSICENKLFGNSKSLVIKKNMSNCPKIYKELINTKITLYNDFINRNSFAFDNYMNKIMNSKWKESYSFLKSNISSDSTVKDKNEYAILKDEEQKLREIFYSLIKSDDLLFQIDVLYGNYAMFGERYYSDEASIKKWRETSIGDLYDSLSKLKYSQIPRRSYDVKQKIFFNKPRIYFILPVFHNNHYVFDIQFVMFVPNLP